MIDAQNPTLLNVSYIRPQRGNAERERFEVIYKTQDGRVHKVDEPAEATFYVVKPEYRDYIYNKPQERMEHMVKVRSKISDIPFTIAKEMGDAGEQLIQQARAERNFSRMKEVFRWPYSFGADFQPEYYYMKDWYDRYPISMPKLTTAYMDIETDMIDYVLDMDDIPNTAHSPVNLITIILDETNESWTFMLRPYKPISIGRSKEEYEQRLKMYEKQMEAHQRMMADKNILINRLHKEFDSMYGHINYHVREFEHEIDLITDAFRLINNRKPNFCLIWNMRFDIQYLYHRILTLGYRPEDIMCHPDFQDKRCYFVADRSTYKVANQFDYFYCSSYTQYLCQMRMYSGIRKSQHTLRSISLNAIADIVLKDKKVEYPAEANIVRFAYLDWILFTVYNIKDVLLQRGIERKVKDVLTFYMRSHSNMTPYNKIFRETHLLRNVREMYFEREGWVQGNNINILGNNDDDEFYGGGESKPDKGKGSFKGAINAEPSMNDNVGLMILGKRSNRLFRNATDRDMGAFYPSIKICSNMDPSTLLFNASFVNEEFISGEKRNRSLNTKYEEVDKYNNKREINITGEAVNTYAGGNILTFGYNYLGLPSMTEIMQRLKRTLGK